MPTKAPRTNKFYLNRYRAVVWLYLADEVEQFARDLRRIFMQATGCFIAADAR